MSIQRELNELESNLAMQRRQETMLLHLKEKLQLIEHTTNVELG